MPKTSELYEAFFWLLSHFESRVRKESFAETDLNEEQLTSSVSEIINYLSLNSANCIEEDDISDSFLLLLRTTALIVQFPDSSCRLFKDLQWKRQILLMFFEKLAVLKIITTKRLEFLSNSLTLPPISREEKIGLSKVKVQAIELDAQLVDLYNRTKDEPEVSFDRKLLIRLLEVEYQIVLDSFARLLVEIQMNSRTASNQPVTAAPRAEAGNRLPFGNSPFVILPTGRDQAKAKVFGSSHRLPTMTIDQYLELERQRGGILDAKSPAKESEEEPEEEMSTLAYDSQEVYRLRDFDAFKDDNRRGSGNRMGKS